jgi:hypothetical protein
MGRLKYNRERTEQHKQGQLVGFAKYAKRKTGKFGTGKWEERAGHKKARIDTKQAGKFSWQPACMLGYCRALVAKELK